MAYNSLTDPSKGLNPSERRVALLAQAQLTTEAIARVMESNAPAIQDILNRPHVQRYMMAVEATYAKDLRSTAARVNETILSQTERAAQVIGALMEHGFENKDEIKFARLAQISAKDILDRVGVSAPKKVDVHTESRHSVDAESLKEVLDVLKEMAS